MTHINRLQRLDLLRSLLQKGEHCGKDEAFQTLIHEQGPRVELQTLPARQFLQSFSSWCIKVQTVLEEGMSNPFEQLVVEENCTPHPCEAVALLLEPSLKELDGLAVRRLLPSPLRQMVGPFIFFDHFGPAQLSPGQGMDVRPHPHINLATVTYLFEGVIRHRDSLGKVQDILPGAVNLMLAGRGIVHSERTPPETRSTAHRLHGLQLWLALPEQTEETEANFYHYPAERLPVSDSSGVALKLIMGEAFGMRSPVATFSPTLYAEATLQPGAEITLPTDVAERAVYLVSGHLEVGNQQLREQTMAVFESDRRVTLVARRTSVLALIGGTALGPRHMYWNFISSRQERIDKAKRDWKEGRFPQVPGETESIPLPEHSHE